MSNYIAKEFKDVEIDEVFCFPLRYCFEFVKTKENSCTLKGLSTYEKKVDSDEVVIVKLEYRQFT